MQATRNMAAGQKCQSFADVRWFLVVFDFLFFFRRPPDVGLHSNVHIYSIARLDDGTLQHRGAFHSMRFNGMSIFAVPVWCVLCRTYTTFLIVGHQFIFSFLPFSQQMCRVDSVQVNRFDAVGFPLPHKIRIISFLVNHSFAYLFIFVLGGKLECSRSILLLSVRYRFFASHTARLRIPEITFWHSPEMSFIETRMISVVRVCLMSSSVNDISGECEDVISGTRKRVSGSRSVST